MGSDAAALASYDRAILNRFDACRRWLLDRADSPWYPSPRLFRRARLADWSAPLEQMTRDLRFARDAN
jgi:hypothetical protein